MKKVKTSPLLLLVIFALVVVLGVEIVQVYQKLDDARAEEALLSQQLAQQQAANDALRDDLSRADDEEFWKKLARENDLYEAGTRIFYDVNE